MVLFFKYLVPKGYVALTLFPFVFVRDKSLINNKRLMNHEYIHLKQQLELLIILFYFWYVLEFLIRLVHYKSWHLAYVNISFEREAYLNDVNLKYLENRKPYQFLKYIRR